MYKLTQKIRFPYHKIIDSVYFVVLCCNKYFHITMMVGRKRKENNDYREVLRAHFSHNLYFEKEFLAYTVIRYILQD
jgi:hypothetical protein